MTRAYTPAWLVSAVAGSAALVLAAPWAGQLRAWLRDASGARFTSILAALLLIAAVAAVAIAVARIRERRAARLLSLLAAAGLGAGYMFVSRTGHPEVDAVERLHFLEYGVITFLFYKSWRPIGDGAALVLPVLAAFIVGICEEWFQWFVPARVGELRDVLLNAVAIGCGLLFCVGLDPPRRPTLSLRLSSRRLVAMVAGLALVVLGAFVHAVHLGHEIADREAGVFRSRYTAEELRSLASQRAAEWAATPPVTWSRFSREDQYFSEAIAHVQLRNQRWQEGNILAAHHENLILERYYAPVLDTPSYVSETAHRWPAAQRAEAESQPGPGFMIYESDALPYPVFTWPPWLFWLGVLTLLAGVLRVLRPF